MSGYDFNIVFRGSTGNVNTDFFSRFPIQSWDDVDLDPDEHYVCASVTDKLPITAAESVEVQRRLAYLQRCMNIHPLVGQSITLVQSLNYFGFAEMSWL